MSRRGVGALLAWSASMASRYEEAAGLPDTLFGPDDAARRVDAVDAAQPYHRRQSRNLAHDEGVRVLAEDKRQKRAAKRLALAAAGQIGSAREDRMALAVARAAVEVGR